MLVKDSTLKLFIFFNTMSLQDHDFTQIPLLYVNYQCIIGKDSSMVSCCFLYGLKFRVFLLLDCLCHSRLKEPSLLFNPYLAERRDGFPFFLLCKSECNSLCQILNSAHRVYFLNPHLPILCIINPSSVAEISPSTRLESYSR